MSCRVLVYGGRDFVPDKHSWGWLVEQLQDLEYDAGPCTVISGRAAGADCVGESAAASLDILVETFPALWKEEGRAAGHLRNQRMLDSGIDVAIQLPGGRGTEDMRRRLDKAGVVVYEYGGGEE